MMKRIPQIDKEGIVRLEFPVDVIIETCGYCNLACIMCPYPTLKRKKGEMEFPLFKKIVDEVSQHGKDTRVWLAIMGEPLMGKQFCRMVDYASSLNLDLHLNTNATFLEGQCLDTIVNSNINKVIVSIDASTKKTYDIIRKNGDYDRVEKNIRALLSQIQKKPSNKPDVIVQFIVMDENAQEMEEFKRKWLEFGAIVKLRLRLGWGQGVEAKDLKNAKIERFPCPWLLRQISIQWNGVVNQCDGDYEGHYCMGNLNEQSIRDIWHGEFRRRQDRHWANDFTHPLCKDCHDWSCGRAEFHYPEK